MKIQAVKVEDAVGSILSHDLTQVVRGEFKGAPFKKGHIITEEDIPELLKMGKENIYILELIRVTSMRILPYPFGKAVAGPNVTWTGPGKAG